MGWGADLGSMAPEAAPPGLREREGGPWAPPPGLKDCVNSWLELRCMGLTGLSIMLSCLEGIRLHSIRSSEDQHLALHVKPGDSLKAYNPRTM